MPSRINLAQILQRGAGAQRGEQIHFAFTQQAQAQAPIRGQAGPGAGGAEGHGDRGDEAHLALRARQAVDARLAVQLAVVGQLQRAKLGLDALPGSLRR